MKKVIKEFIIDIFRQLFGWSKPRDGVIIPTSYTLRKMREYGVDIATLEDVFRHGVGKKQKLSNDMQTLSSGFITKQLNARVCKPNHSM
jgi:hypothetical protein